MPFEFVSDTTPILNFLKIKRLDILKETVKNLIIPDAVFQEIECGKDKDYYENLKNFPWIQIVHLKETSLLDMLIELDRGEAETIALAKELKIKKVIIDEKLGRNYALESNLNVIGTLGLLLKAKEIGLIEKVEPLIIELENNNTWLHKTVKMNVLSAAGEI